MKQSSEPLILLDADVVRHFINGSQIHRLASIYPDRFVMLEIVRDELRLSAGLRVQVDNFLSMTKISLIPLPKDQSIIKEFAMLKKTFGTGESACMAVAKFQHQYIASSNLKDIELYCDTNGIRYLTTMDILMQAMTSGVFTEIECDQFIADVLAKGSRLPCKTMSDYKKLVEQNS